MIYLIKITIVGQVIAIFHLYMMWHQKVLVDYLTSDNGNELPKAYQLIKYLTPKDLKKEYENNRYIESCNLCDRWMYIDEFDKHYDKCLHKFGKIFKNTKRI